MAKTTFSSGVIVTSAWLNGAKDIRFDGQDLDWHYDPLGLSSLVVSGPDGLDSRYITLASEQPVLSTSGLLLTGQLISGNKVVSGRWNFGLDPTENPTATQNRDNAPRSYLTNLKFQHANGIPSPTSSQKFAALDNADLITKEVLAELLADLVIDEGEY